MRKGGEGLGWAGLIKIERINTKLSGGQSGSVRMSAVQWYERAIYIGRAIATSG